MNYMKNERGTSAFYLLWLFGVFFILFFIIINIAKVFVVKEQANLAVEQAAIAGTSVLIDKTKEAITSFDSSLESESQKLADLKTIEEQVEEKKREYLNQHYSKTEAYIQALNNVLPNKIRAYPSLKQEFTYRFASTPISVLVNDAVQQVLEDNHGNLDDPSPEIILSKDNGRLEIKATVTFESISDQKLISQFIDKVPQKGYGPRLIYLKEVM